MIYFDISKIMHWPKHGYQVTGIQRVTIECFKGLLDLLGDDALRLMRFHTQTNSLQIAAASSFGDAVVDVSVHEKVAARTNEISGTWSNPVFQKQDIIFLSEGLDGVEVFQHLERLKKSVGFRVFQIIYDIIPKVRPDFCNAPSVIGFNKALPRALQLCDEIISISEFTKSDIIKNCSDDLSPDVVHHVWRLPHEFTAPAAPNIDLPSKIRKNFVLIVGTIDDRKNQFLVVNAWRKLAVKHGKNLPQLVLAGKFGNKSRNQFVMRCQLALEFIGEKNVIALSRCPDYILRTLYDRCLFSIYVSSYEGWGLPIGEGLWCRRPVLSGISTSLPEVGGELADYVNPNDEPALMEAIEKLCFEVAHREAKAKQIANATLRTWKDATKELSSYVT